MKPHAAPDPDKADRAALAARVLAFRAGDIALEAGGLPTRLLVAPWGTHQTRKGPVTVDATTLRVLPANQAVNRFDRVALDFNHGTLAGKEPVKVAAFGRPNIINGEGIWLEDLQWTPEGREHAAHYCDISPAVIRDKADGATVTMLHSASLCRQGEIAGLDFFSADLPAGDAPDAIDNDNTAAMFKDLLVSLLVALGSDLPEHPNDDQIAAAADALLNDRADAVKETAEEGGETEVDAMAAAGPATRSAVDAQVVALSARIEAMEGQRDADERGRILAGASLAGKVVPLSAADVALTPVPVLRNLVENLKPGEVPTDSRTAGAREATTPDAFAADPALAIVAANCGVPIAEVVKFAAAQAAHA